LTGSGNEKNSLNRLGDSVVADVVDSMVVVISPSCARSRS
jgi:hypothetical protein